METQQNGISKKTVIGISIVGVSILILLVVGGYLVFALRTQEDTALDTVEAGPSPVPSPTPVATPTPTSADQKDQMRHKRTTISTLYLQVPYYWSIAKFSELAPLTIADVITHDNTEYEINLYPRGPDVSLSPDTISYPETRQIDIWQLDPNDFKGMVEKIKGNLSELEYIQWDQTVLQGNNIYKSYFLGDPQGGFNSPSIYLFAETSVPLMISAPIYNETAKDLWEEAGYDLVDDEYLEFERVFYQLLESITEQD